MAHRFRRLTSVCHGGDECIILQGQLRCGKLLTFKNAPGAFLAHLTAGPLVFLPIRPDPPISEVYMVYRRERRTPVLEAFVAHVRAELAQAVP